MDDQGQMNIDYIIGISIFLMGIIFVFSYTSGMFVPFQSNSDEITLIADRISTNMVEQTLSAEETGTTNLLDGVKVSDFFAQFTLNYEDTIDHFGLNGTYLRYDLNMTIENETDTMYAAGRTLPQNMNIGQTKRIVLIRDDSTGNVSTATLSVRVW
ncbi:DUF7287 family protein [Methanolobus profundi]|uniref:Uncharacterized protein n=1 Tax=Methanolobus profundi TaxID=487685 RepID=A0A1I4SSF7_9EURY|nr:hypothetical protein [Methanolobus profundi]SFM67372.1 hypothetical protein SAMN04488696_1989 [Methanolobus profundi]